MTTTTFNSFTPLGIVTDSKIKPRAYKTRIFFHPCCDNVHPSSYLIKLPSSTLTSAAYHAPPHKTHVKKDTGFCNHLALDVCIGWKVGWAFGWAQFMVCWVVILGQTEGRAVCRFICRPLSNLRLQARRAVRRGSQ